MCNAIINQVDYSRSLLLALFMDYIFCMYKTGLISTFRVTRQLDSLSKSDSVGLNSVAPTFQLFS
jgi:hypothetical protein